MSNAQLRNQRVDCPHLNSRAPAAVAKFGGVNVILSIWDQQRQSGKLPDEFLLGLWSRKALQELLQNEPGSDDGVAPFKRGTQGLNLRLREIGIAAKCQRPYAGIDKQGHRRDRSTL